MKKQKIDEIVELIQYLIEDDSNIEKSLSNKKTGTKLLKLDEIKESINSVQSSKVKELLQKLALNHRKSRTIELLKRYHILFDDRILRNYIDIDDNENTYTLSSRLKNILEDIINFMRYLKVLTVSLLLFPYSLYSLVDPNYEIDKIYNEKKFFIMFFL